MDKVLEDAIAAFAIVRERILARRNPERLRREQEALAVLTDAEIDALERSVTPWLRPSAEIIQLPVRKIR